MMDAERKHVVVLGAGVIGLQIAVTLLEAGCDVTVIAHEWADGEGAMERQSWTSPWAGAQWRAHAAGDTSAAKWEAATYRAWAQIHASEAVRGYANGQGPSSLASITMENQWTSTTEPATSEKPPWWSALDPASFTEVAASDLPPGITYGTRMRAFTLEPGRYLNWLLQRLRGLGGRTIQAVLAPATRPTAGVIEAARRIVRQENPMASPPSAFVNALGLGVAALGIDTSVIPNRGQTLLVKGETQSMRTRLGPRAGDVLAIIPRPGTGTTIVGSTRGPGRRDGAEDTEETAWLLRAGREVAPELFETKGEEGEAEGGRKGEVIRANVGFRPRRGTLEKGIGARVERETIDETTVVHAYGHEGAGFQQSIGTAVEVRRLLGIESEPQIREVKL